MPESTAKVKARLPHVDDHIPRDRKLPSGVGLPVRINYEGAPVGRVTGWEDHGDGTVTAELEIPSALLGEPAGISFGIDALAQMRRDRDRVVVDEISTLKGIGVWPTGSRGETAYDDDCVEPEGDDA